MKFIASILDAAVRDPEAPALTLVGKTDRTLSRSELIQCIGSVASQVCEETRPGDRVLVALPWGEPLIAALLGVLFAGRVVVPAPGERGARAAQRLRLLAADAGCALAFCDSPLDAVRVRQPRLDLAPSLQPPLDGLALLQYTSGSTARPKGVQISSTNLDANLETIARSFAQTSDDIVVGWLPLFHDMGLIGTLLHPLRQGQHAVLMSPADFLARPAQWLRTISRYRASTSGGPDFGYAWTADRVDPETQADVDLSCWRVAFTGSEPISLATIARFEDRFAQLGFGRGVFTPCYGLAETTLLVSAAPVGRPIRIVDGRVGCGMPGEAVAITDSRGNRLASGVGEIRVRGPNVGAGYRNRPSGDTFGTRVVGSGAGWLRTGDLGFLDSGELFIAGRSKEILILRGANHHPQDLEAAVAAAIPGATVCAFPLADRYGEGVGLGIEARGDPEALIVAARRGVREALGFEPAAVGILRGRSLPRTTSGKLQRAAFRQAWLDGALPLLRLWTPALEGRPPEGRLEIGLSALWTELLGIETPSADASFFALGGASLLAVTLATRIEETFKVAVPPQALLAAGSLAEQARLIEAAPALAPPPIEPATAPMSLQQEGLSMLVRLSATAQTPVTVRLAIPAEIELAPLLAQLVARHPGLSATLDSENCISPVPWAWQDGQPDLAAGRPFTVTREADEVTLSFDHRVIDGWSIRVLLDELAALIEARPLPAAPPSAFAWTAAQRLALQAGDAGEALDFHGQRWGPTRIELPWRVPDDSGVGLSRHPIGSRSALRAAAAALETTVAQLVLAAAAVVLARLSGQSRVRIAIPIANREAPWTRTVGCLVSLQLASIDVAAEATGYDLKDQIAAELDRLRSHSAVPLEALAARLGLPRRVDLVDVVFDHLVLPERIGPLTLVDGSPLHCPAQAKVPLTLTAIETEQVELALLYRRNYLDADQAAELAEQIALALDQLCRQPDIACRTWSLRTARAEACLPLDTAPIVAPDQPLIPDRVFAAPPDAVALVRGGESWTYGALQTRALEVCGALQRAGAASGEVVGVLGSASFETLVAMLGTLAAGCAILNLDRRLPAGRLVTMVQETRARFVLRADGEDARDGALPATLLEPAGPQGSRTAPAQGDSAYVVFTTGSTRAPKAILGTHRGLAHFLAWQAETFGIDQDDRFVLLTNLAFDMALRDVWLPLTAGARLHLLDRANAVDGAHVGPLLRQWCITRLHLVPTLARSWLRTTPPMRLGSLRTVFFAGEPLTDTLVEQFRAHVLGDYEALNFYGPSETTQTKIFYRVPATPDPGVQPIGRPLPQTRIALINPAGAACGLGEAGEIVIRTPFASRGYLNAPQDQAARFIADPLGSGEPVYRSGDIGRARLDGAIEILGRGDSQVKVRGTAVQPAEIADLLESLPGVRQAAVAAVAGPDGDYQLFAWIAGDRSWPDLRAELADRLPAALVPERAMRLESLPVHPNGKVNIRSLPRPEVDDVAAADDLPLDAIEAVVLAIWREALGRPDLGLDAGFLDSGGHSLKAFELIEALRRELGREISAAALLEGATPRSLARDLARVPAAVGELPTLTADPERMFDAFPMTCIQEAYWVGRRSFLGLDAAAQTYRELRCAPDLDLAALENAFETLVKRHPMLRTIATEDGRQRVLAEVPRFRIAVQDLRDHPAPEAAVSAWREAMSHSLRPLEQWPLIEVRASRLADEVRLHIGLEAFICDAWSRVLLLEELHQLMRQPGTALAPIGVTFRDYQIAVDQRSRTAAWDWWRSRLDSLPPPPALPLARRNASGFTRRQDRLDAERWLRFRQRAKAAGVTPSAALLAAFGLVLARWGGGDRLTVNIAVFQRLPLHADVNRMLGDFTAVLPHTVEAIWSSFRDHARAEQARLWQELAHADVSGVDLAREAARRTGQIDATGFPVVFTSALTTPELAREFDWSWLGELVHGISQTPQVWLDLQVYEYGGELHHNWDCVEQLFQPGVPDAMARAWSRLLESLTDQLWDQMSVDLLPPADAAMFQAANATSTPLEVASLVDGVRASAERTPDAMAVLDPERSLTYAELIAEAERVAAAILAAGVSRESLVAVIATPGWRQAVAALGVLVAGAAYLPLNADQPVARIEQILVEAGPALILRTADAWTHGLVLDSLPPGRARRDPRPDDLAYVIYTSGSTGRPKGVVIRHRMAVNTLADIAQRLALGPQHRAIALSSLAFDLSVWDLFGSWRLGAATVYAANRSDVRSWIEAVERHDVRLWNSVPMIAQMLLDRVEAEPGLVLPASLDRFLLSGDWITLGLAEQLRAAYPSASLWSLGGATEGSIWSIAYPIDRVDPAWDSIPYGMPLANQTIEVLDKALRPCPLWVTGRIFIGGEGVAAGYWRQPELTRERFIERDGTRLYDTGDLGRWRSDGQVEILGRADRQVKIRGHRVEIGEIEHVLETISGVAQAAVVAIGTPPAPLQLSAFVVPDGSGRDLDDIRAELAARLPDYLVPAHWTALAALPLSSNGKVERSALRDRAVAPAVVAVDRALEAVVASAWETVLGAPPTEPTMSFFSAGGDSVSWLRLCAQVSRLGWHLPNAAVLRDATLIGLAAQLQRHASAPVAFEGTAPLAPMQRWLARRGMPGHFNQAVLLVLREPVPLERLRRAIGAAAAVHPAFGIRIEGDEQRFRQLQPAIETAELFDDRRIAQACRGFDLQGSLLRATLAPDQLLLCAHHLACDAHSWSILIEDIEFALDRLEQAEPANLAPEAVPFGVWCRTLAQRFPPATAHKPPTPAAPPSRVSRRVLTREADEVERLCDRQRCSQEEVLAALAIAARGAAEGIWEIELERNGRALPGLDCSRTVGWMTALVSVRAAAGPAVEVLKAVKTALRGQADGGLGLAAGLADGEPGLVVNPLGTMTEMRSRRFAPRYDAALPAIDPAVGPPGRSRLILSRQEGRLVADLLHDGTGETLLEVLEAVLHRLLEARPDDAITVADFPESTLGEDDLRIVLATLEAQTAKVADLYRLTPLQEAMLFRSVLEPGSAAYWEQLTIWLETAPDPRALAAVWRALLARHPVLRTSFHHQGLPHPHQAVRTEVVLPWREVQCSETGAAAERAIKAVAWAERAQGFDLETAPLFRLALVRSGDGRACLIWTFHHLILDGWSLGRVVLEIDRRYREECLGNPPPPAPGRPFRDHIRWLAGQDQAAASRWWAQRLDGAPARTPVPGVLGGDGHEHRRSLDAETSERIMAARGDLGVTLATLVRLAWAACLAEHDQLRDVCFGTLVAGRPADLSGVDEIFGLFVNTVATWVRFEPDETVRVLLNRLQREAFRERDFEWASLGECLRAAGMSPLDSVVVVENYPLDQIILRDSLLKVSHIEVCEQADVALVVAIVPGREIELRLAAPPGGLDRSSVEALAQRLVAWLGDLPAHADDTFAELLGARELAEQRDLRRQLWVAPPTAATLTEAIFRHGMAIVDETGRWAPDEVLAAAQTYARIAHAAPPGPVAVIGETRPETVARMLGCLRAGRAYVPLELADPRNPERLAHAGATALGHLLEESMPPWPAAGDRAYLLYTSGSTGRPKAVLQTQAGVLAHAQRFAAAIGLTSEDRLCATAAFAYDAAAMDIFACAIVGAELRLASPARLGIDRLRREMLADATVLHTTPSLFRLLAAEPLGRDLRLVVLGGEAVRASDLDRFEAAAPLGCVLVNGFGPSESTTGAQWFARRGVHAATVPIGLAVDETRILLVGPDGQPREGAWAEGEIVIESAAVALGYLGEPTENAQFSGEGESRRYRTGDLGRRRPSGCFDYLGRLDDQVQLAGVRVEPAEVARALADAPSVTAAEVFATGEGDDLRLEGWVTPADVDIAALRAALRQRLPRRLIPARLHAVARFELLPNGKVDRLRLWASALDPSPPTAAAADPSVAAAIVAGIAEVLGRPVGLDDSFFDLGGHSLDALRVCGRLERYLKRPVPLQLLFDHPSPVALAAALDAAVAPQVARVAIPRIARQWTGGRAPRSDSMPRLSLFFFAGEAADPEGGYRLLREAAIRADTLGLHALWLPERHFAEFGGLYPNPSVLAGHLAGCTSRIRLRAGSVVLPLHDPLRVAEEWSVVDQLSGGRVDLAIASGWHRQDFSALAPAGYARRRETMFEKLDLLRRLWAGEAISVLDEDLGSIAISTWPRPVQPQLDIWLTSQSLATFQAAGERGLNVLTNLNYKSLDELTGLIGAYRQAGDAARPGEVAVMTHALVGSNDDAVRRQAAAAYARYTRSNLALQQRHARGPDLEIRPDAADLDALAANAAARLLEQGSLIGDPDRCRERIAALRAAGADEIACLIDFGVAPDLVLEGVVQLAALAAPAELACAAPAAALLPATPLQEQLWVLEALSQGGGVWMIPTLVRLEGPLDVEQLAARLQAVGRRHEALRTALVERDGVVRQQVMRTLDLSLEQADADDEAEAISAARAILERGLDLTQAPLMRAVLFRIDLKLHILLLACHHAIADGSSTAVLARELLEGPPGGEAPLQPGDWAAWLAARIDAGELDEQAAWWDRQLADPPERLVLGQGRPTGERRVLEIPFDDQTVTACRAACRRAQCTLFELLLAAYAVALSRLTGRDDFLLGLHHANRTYPELEGLVGPLVNLLPLRVNTAGADRLADLRDAARVALRHHEVPYARLAARHGERGRPDDPLLDAVMVHQNLPEMTQSGPIWWSRIELDGGRTRFPLTFVVREASEQLRARLEVDAGCFPENSAAALADLLSVSLAGLMAPDGEGEACVRPSPAVSAPGPHLLAAFLEHAVRHPGEMAVHGPDGDLTRGELLAQARRLAGALRERVGPGARVGVSVPPGADMLVAVYGVLLADCTLVPLDPRDPPTRRAAELALAQAACVVAHEPSAFPTLSPLQAGPPLETPPIGAHPAYLIFTSGSTGVPKGVVVGHDSVRALIGWAREAFSPEELSGALLTAPIRFDMSVFGLYVPLAGPGAIVVVPDLSALVDSAPSAPVSLIYTVPSALRALLAAGAPLPAGLRTVNLGGEALDAELVARLLGEVARVCNLYGPTEATSNCFFEDYRQAQMPTIGRPIAGSGAWIRRPDGQPARLGEVGELVLTGAALAQGYLDAQGDQAFTAQGYRTGDRAHMLPDGRFVYHGRADAQVKVRGFRLELGEVEHHLAALDGVHAAAARVRDGSLEALLVHACAPEAPRPASPVRVRSWAAALRERLPAHATPSRWISLPALPLTANGKLDRTALDRIAWSPATPVQSSAAREATIAAAWEEVLGIAPPDFDTSFFEFGGHSLLAIKLRRILEDQLDQQVLLRTLFDHPSIRGLAAALAGPRAAIPAAAVFRTDDEHRHQPFSLTPLQQAYWVGARADLTLGGVATQAYIELETRLPLERLEAAFAALVARHAMLRAVIDPDGRQRVLAEPGPFPLPVESLVDGDGTERIAALRAERSHHRCDPTDWPLLRVWALRLPDHIVLQISLPALLLDAQSAYLIARELEALVEDRPLPDPGPAFRDVVLAQAATAAAHAGRTDLPLGPQLPLARDPASLETVRFRRAVVRLPAEVWAGIKAAGAAWRMTPAGTVLAAFAWTLTAWAEQTPFSLVVTYFDRPPIHPEIDRVVGDFTSARLVQVEAAADLVAFGARLQADLWEALDDPGRDSVRCVRALRRLGQDATFGVVFTSLLGLNSSSGGGLGVVTHALTQTSQVWLDHKVREQDGILVCTWDFVDRLLSPGVPEAMLEVFETVLRSMAGDGWSAAAPPLPAAQALMRAAYNATGWSPDLAPLHRMLCDDPSEAESLICGEDRMTRRELAAAAAQLAERLRADGLASGELVAVPSVHGWRQAVAALGVMAAGGAWTPIDPSWPPERIRRVLEVAGVRRGVGWSGVALPGVEQTTNIDDQDRAAPLSPLSDVNPEGLAYVIFTSGSTGVPKGVAVQHAAAANTLADLADRFGLRGERVLGLSHLHFDLSVFDMFGIWLTGGAVIYPTPGDLRDPEAWVRLARAERVTVWNSVPILALMLVEHLEARGERLGDLRLALLSGDWIPVDLPDRLRAVAPNCQVVGLGGATEGAIWSIAYPIEEVDPAWTSIPYGKPLRGQGMHILDEHRRPRPDWAVGEIHIAGRGVALGYRGAPLETACSFWRNPDTEEAMYATGDLGRFRPEGWIEFLGRRDGQVKVRGHRIELGEIEAALREHPQVRQAVASAPLAASGQRRLVAHVVAEVSEAALRDHLTCRLPASHVPQQIITLNTLPLSSNGKVDRTALAVPATDPAVPALPALLALLREMLERPNVGPDDDFFTLGGDSVLAVRLLTRVEQAFMRRLSIRQVFAHPTARGLAVLIADGGVVNQPSLDPETRRLAREQRGRRLSHGPVWPLGGGPTVSKRESHRSFSPLPIAASVLEALAATLCTALDGRRRHPSAGSAYGVQAYWLLAPDRVEGRSGGWWLDADGAQLVPIGPDGWTPSMGDRPPNTALASEASFGVVLVADLDTLEPLYGSEALRLATLEAGYMGQLIASEAAGLDLSLCPVGSLDEARVTEALDLGPRRRIVHSLLGGRPLESLIVEDARWTGVFSPQPPSRPQRRAERILLTGVTGRLGSAVLRALVRQGHAVTCLIRGDADRRIEQLLVRLGLTLAADQVLAAAGDLAQGLDLARLGDVDTVIHAAADVSFVKPYAALRGSNVQGTRTILDLCAACGARLHYLSSLSIFREAGNQMQAEDTPPPIRPPRVGGYAQSKWAAEQMVRDFVAQGGQAHVHRLALVASAAPDPSDYVAALQSVCRAISAWPEVEVDLPLVRLETAAAAIVAAIGQTPRTWHLQEPAKVTMRQLADHIGGLEGLPPDRWLRRVEVAVAGETQHPLSAYIEVLREARNGGALDRKGPRGSRLDGTESWRILGDLGVEPTSDPGVMLAVLT